MSLRADGYDEEMHACEANPYPAIDAGTLRRCMRLRSWS